MTFQEFLDELNLTITNQKIDTLDFRVRVETPLGEYGVATVRWEYQDETIVIECES